MTEIKKECETKHQPLAVGTQYLKIGIEFFGSWFYLPAFINTEKQNANQPDFKGRGVCVFVKEKKANTQPKKVLL